MKAFSERTRERLRSALSQQETDGISFTASFGVATRRGNEAFEAWVARADNAMYAAKTAGRNCIRADEALPVVGERAAPVGG